MLTREISELALVAYCIERGTLAPLLSRGVGVDYFGSYADLMRQLLKTYKKRGSLPTREMIASRAMIELPPAPEERDFDEYLEVVRDAHADEEIVRAFGEYKEMFQDPERRPNIPAKMQKDAHRFQQIRAPRQIIDIAGDSFERYNRFIERGDELANGTYSLAMAVPSMNAYVGGYQDQELAVYVSRPGVGKSFSLILDAFNCWLQGASVLFVSLEMPTHDVGYRFDALASRDGDDPGFSIFNLRKGLAVKAANLRPSDKASRVTEDHRDRYRTYVEELMRKKEAGECSPFYVVTPHNAGGQLTPSYIEALASDFAVDIVFVDYLGIAQADSFQDDKRNRIGEVSWAFKQSAMRLNIPYVSAHQLNRDSEKTQKVTLANFAESDDVGRNIDIGIHVTKDESQDIVTYELLKVRGGPASGKFAVAWSYDDGVWREVAVPTDSEIDDFDLPSGDQALVDVWNTLGRPQEAQEQGVA